MHSGVVCLLCKYFARVRIGSAHGNSVHARDCKPDATTTMRAYGEVLLGYVPVGELHIVGGAPAGQRRRPKRSREGSRAQRGREDCSGGVTACRGGAALQVCLRGGGCVRLVGERCVCRDGHGARLVCHLSLAWLRPCSPR